MAVLQLWRLDLISALLKCSDVPCSDFRSVQVAPIEPEVILLAVGWYLRFSLSYRDVEELLAERGLHADHVTSGGLVQRYAPEVQRRLRPRLRPTNDSWRVDSDLHPSQGQVGVLVPGRGLRWCNDRLPSLG